MQFKANQTIFFHIITNFVAEGLLLYSYILMSTNAKKKKRQKK